ncbi:MAG: hypothetical protein RLZ92_655 [Pseudomonadota bacterium]|jgi:hypothetical protein
MSKKPTSLIALIVFWLYVVLPLIWGVSATIKKALALFA